MVVLSPDFYCMVDCVDNDCSSEELITKILINLLAGDEVGRNADHAFFLQSIFTVKSLSAFDICQR